jgi:hypothetical protein
VRHNAQVVQPSVEAPSVITMADDLEIRVLLPPAYRPG